MSQVNLAKVKASFKSRVKLAVATDQFKKAINVGDQPEEVIVCEHLVKAVEIMERRDAFTIHTPSLKMNAEAQRMLSLPGRLQGHKASWTTFLDARNIAGKQTFPVAWAALQQYRKALEAGETEGSTANSNLIRTTASSPNLKQQQQPQMKRVQSTVRGKVTEYILLDVGTSKLDIERGYLAHVWRTAEGAVNFTNGFQRIWQALFEYHLEALHVPMSVMYQFGGTYVSVTALPPCYVEGLVDRGEAPKYYPQEGEAEANSVILSHTCKQLMAALRIPHQHVLYKKGLPLFTSRDGRHYLLNLGEILQAHRLTTFPLQIARRELLSKMLLTDSESEGGNSSLSLEQFMVQRAIPDLVHDLWQRMHKLLYANPQIKVKELSVTYLLKGNVIRSAMKEHGVNMTMLWQVHQYVLSQAKYYTKNPPEPMELSQTRDFGRVDASIFGGGGGAGVGLTSPDASPLRRVQSGVNNGSFSSPTAPAAGGNGGGDEGDPASPQATMAMSGVFSDEEGEEGKEQQQETPGDYFVPENVVDLCKQIVVALRTEMVGRVLKAFLRADIENAIKKGKSAESDFVDVVNRLGKLTTEQMNSSFWAEHIVPAVRKKFKTSETFSLRDKEIHMASALSLMTNAIGAEFDKKEGKFQSIKKVSGTDHVCLACPPYLIRDELKDSTGELIQKCWDAAEAHVAYNIRNSLTGTKQKHTLLYQLLISRACCLSLHMGTAHEELADSVITLANADPELIEDGENAKLRFSSFAAELPVACDRQAELISQFQRRLEQHWPSPEDPGAKHQADGAALALMMGGAGRSVEVMMQHAAAQKVTPLALAAKDKHQIDEVQLRIDALTTSVKIPGINVSLCLLTQALTREVLRHIPVATGEQRAAISFILRGLIVNLSYSNNEKEQAAELAIDALTAFMMKEEYYRTNTDLMVELACEGVEANVEVFGRDALDTQNMVYRLAKIVAITQHISKLDATLQSLIEQAQEARAEAKRAPAVAGGDAQGKQMAKQVAILMLARKKAPVAALRKAATITDSTRAKKILEEHANYLGGDLALGSYEKTDDYKASNRDKAIVLIQRVARAKKPVEYVQSKIDDAIRAAEERALAEKVEKEDAAKKIQGVARKRLERNAAKAEMQRRISQLHAARKVQAYLRCKTGYKHKLLKELWKRRREGTDVIQRVYRSRVGFATIHLEVAKVLAEQEDEDERGIRRLNAEEAQQTKLLNSMYHRHYDPQGAAAEAIALARRRKEEQLRKNSHSKRSDDEVSSNTDANDQPFLSTSSSDVLEGSANENNKKQSLGTDTFILGVTSNNQRRGTSPPPAVFGATTGGFLPPFGGALPRQDAPISISSLTWLHSLTQEQEEGPLATAWGSMLFSESSSRHNIVTTMLHCWQSILRMNEKMRAWGVKNQYSRRSSLRVMQLKHKSGGGDSARNTPRQGGLIGGGGGGARGGGSKTGLQIAREEEDKAKVLATHIAARKIQCAWRCNMARFERRLRSYRKAHVTFGRRRHLAARLVQALVRSFLCRISLVAKGIHVVPRRQQQDEEQRAPKGKEELSSRSNGKNGGHANHTLITGSSR